MGLTAMLLMPFNLDVWPLYAMGYGLDGIIWIADFIASLGRDGATGQLPFIPTVILSAAFIALVLLRSHLRLLACAPALTGLILMPMMADPPPDIIVSEDGRLIGLPTDELIATNAIRPSRFIFEQWRRAYRRMGHLKPLGTNGKSEIPIANHLTSLYEKARANPGRFICKNRNTCLASVKGRIIAALGKVEHIKIACENFDIIILAAPTAINACQSNAMLFTAQSLRRSGALAIRISENMQGPNEMSVTFETALGGVIRPWTIQRYFDWRLNGFRLPDSIAARAILAKPDRARIWRRSNVKKKYASSL